MPILGARLKAELAHALGLQALRKELRAELRSMSGELRRLTQVMRTSRVANGRGRPAGAAPQKERGVISAADVSGLRRRLGETRKAFAARLHVSPSIIFAWETGRSVPRRTAIVTRIQALMASPGAPATGGRRVVAAPARQRRAVRLSPRRRAALKLQGRYIGLTRN